MENKELELELELDKHGPDMESQIIYSQTLRHA